MATISLNNPPKSGSADERPIVPTDVYRMKIAEAKLEEDKWAKPNKDGSLPIKLVLTFDMGALTEEQQEIEAESGQDWSKVRIWHRFAPYYGDVKAGGPSKFKAFIDNLVKWGLLNIPNPDAFDVSTLDGIELKCSVAETVKTMGDNAGDPVNKITAFAAVRTKSKNKNVPEPPTAKDEDEEGDLF